MEGKTTKSQIEKTGKVQLTTYCRTSKLFCMEPTKSTPLTTTASAPRFGLSMYQQALKMYNEKLERNAKNRAPHKAKVKKANRARNKVARKSRMANRG